MRCVSSEGERAVSGGPLRAEAKFRFRLKEVMREVRENTDTELQGWGEDLVGMAKRLAPKRTGAMAETIEIVMSAEEMRRVVREKKPGAAQEFGAAHHGAQPHLIPAEFRARDNMRERIEKRGLV